MSKTVTEDQLSESLTHLLQELPAALDTFLMMAVPKGTKVPSIRLLEISNQHRTDNGRRIDILISHESFGVVVECKAGDPQKPYQLEQYSNYWKRRFGCPPLLVWLVHKEEPVPRGIPVVRLVKRILWTDLVATFLRMLESLKGEKRRLVQEFCDKAESAGVVLQSGEQRVRRRTFPGYCPDHASEILQAIFDETPGLIGGVEQIRKKLNLHLLVGRKSWENKFPDQFIRRVWFYFWPLTDAHGKVGPFTYAVGIHLYNRSNLFMESARSGADLEYALEHIGQWMTICRNAGLTLHQNVPGEYTGYHSCPNPAAIVLKPKPRYIYANNELHPPKPDFDWRDDNAAVKAGVKSLKQYLEIADRFE